MKRLIRVYGLCFWLLASLLYSAGLLVGVARASVYGGGNYGSCSYVSDCQSQPAPTPQATPPATLQVIINLHNGQVIPSSGYLITVMPANAQSTQLKQVTFSINGQLVQTSVPDSDGTVRWFWNPQIYPGTQLTLGFTDQNGQTSAQTFNVSIGQKASVTSPPPAQATQSPIESAVTQVTHLLQKAVAFVVTYKKPIFYTLPYFIFALLAVNGVLLLLQERRELREFHKLQADIQQAQTIAEQKNTFIALISHYLRTPLAIVTDSIELLKMEQGPQVDVAQLHAVAGRLRTKVEQLIERTSNLENRDSENVNASVPAKVSLWRHPTVFLPVVLLGGVAFLFNYLAEKSANLTISQADWFGQAFLYSSIALLTFLIFRQGQLSLRDKHRANTILKARIEVIAAQDTMIATSVTDLTQDLHELERLVPTTSSNAVNLIKDGCQRLGQALDRFAISLKLKGSQSAEPFAALQVRDLFEQAEAALGSNEKLQHANIKIERADGVMYTRSPRLLLIVLTSLLDNALAYSGDNPSIEITCIAKKHQTVLSITDHGKGIPQEFLAAVFRPFTKAEGAEDFTHEGMGFSLYLNRLIMSYLGADIKITSQPGKGTTVNLYMPNPLKV